MKLSSIIKTGSVIFISFVLGAIFGFKQSHMPLWVINAVPEAVLSMGYLQKLEKNNSTPIKLKLNSTIDDGLYYYSLGREEWWFPLFDLLIYPYEKEQYEKWLKTLANYRAQNPSEPADPNSFSDPEIREGIIERNDRINEVIREFSTK